MRHPTAYRTVDVDGLSIFYREVGPRDAPATAPCAARPAVVVADVRAAVRAAVRSSPPGCAGLSGFRTQ